MDAEVCTASIPDTHSRIDSSVQDPSVLRRPLPGRPHLPPSCHPVLSTTHALQQNDVLSPTHALRQNDVFSPTHALRQNDVPGQQYTSTPPAWGKDAGPLAPVAGPPLPCAQAITVFICWFQTFKHIRHLCCHTRRLQPTNEKPQQTPAIGRWQDSPVCKGLAATTCA